jgi:hypothetical protein
MPKKLLTFLLAFLQILGCLFTVLSFIYPFYYAHLVLAGGQVEIYYWSYKADYSAPIIFRPPIKFTQFWFSDFWFSSVSFIGLGAPWILILLFTVQVLTLLFGFASVIFHRRILSILPVLFSLSAITLMIYTAAHAGYSNWGEYQQGYFLVFPSAALFLSAFLVRAL